MEPLNCRFDHNIDGGYTTIETRLGPVYLYKVPFTEGILDVHEIVIREFGHGLLLEIFTAYHDERIANSERDEVAQESVLWRCVYTSSSMFTSFWEIQAAGVHQ